MPSVPSPELTFNRRTLVITLIVVVAVLFTVLIGGEVYARYSVSRCLGKQVEREIGAPVDVSFGARPLLFTLVDDHVSSLTVESTEARFDRTTGMNLYAEFHDIEVPGSNRAGSVGSSSAEVTWSNAGIAETLGGLVSEVGSSPEQGALVMKVLRGLSQVVVKPVIRDGVVEVDVSSAQVLGFGVPEDLAQSIVDLLTKNLQDYPMGMEPVELAITDAGVSVRLVGGRAELPASEGGGSGGLSC